MKKISMFLLAAFAAGCMAQDQAPGKIGHKAAVPVVSADPVTQAEARATFTKVRDALSAMGRASLAFAPSTLSDSSKPITREEVLFEFERLYKGARPDFKVTPRPVWFDPAVLSIKSGPARPLLEQLVRGGFVARVGPLATSKKDTMTVTDFGDSVGIFLSRLANLCNMPTTKFTPFLEKEDQGN